MEALDDQAGEWPELAAFCETQQADAHRWQERQAARQADFAQAQERQRRQAQEAEQRAQQAAAETARIESLSANQRRAEALKSHISPGNRGKGAGDGLFRALRELAQAAAVWSAEDKAYLREIAVEILAHLGIDPKKQDTAKKMLRELG
ncbi:MAG: hypothetical protein EPN21_18965 [Methylococcaceae bacterium]|nr:MAG: hypothetical protein EPN21_18965 [Methylococcaceae bacterium]